MKNEELNLAELLKDCPIGTKFYSPMFGYVFLSAVKTNKIEITIQDDDEVKSTTSVKVNGYFNSNFSDGECMLFPSKDQRDWTKFKTFHNGDVLTTKLGTIFIYHYSKLEEISNESICCAHIAINPTDKIILNNDEFAPYMSMCSLATKEEKELLLNILKENYLQWNAETKTLEKLIVPKFKVGDKIRHKTTNKDDIYEISKVYDNSYGLVDFTWMIYMKYQDNYELVPNKFDISTLQPFDKVLCRHSDKDKWKAHFFSHIDTGDREYPFYATFSFRYCIPYNLETEHLVGTTDKAPEFYINWEEE